MTRQAAKNKRYRARQRCGIAVITIPIDQHAVATALIESGRMRPADTLERNKVAAAVTQIVDDFTKRWAAS